MGAPERHPPPDAQRPGLRARVDDRARIPRPAAQDERAGREGLGGSRPGELEGEVRPVEMEESHRAGSVRGGSRGLGAGRGADRRGGRPGGGRRRARRRPRRGSGASPAAPAGRSGCGRPAPRCAGRRCRARGGSTTGGPARGGGRSIRRRRSARPPARPGGSSTTSSVSARRASAARRPSRSAMAAGRSVAARRPPGRSRTSRSTERPASSAPPMARPSSSVSGVMTTSHSRRTPRATASTGSKLRDEVEPGHDRARGLGLGGEPQDERGPAARAVAADRDARRAGQAAGSQDRVERREAGPDDPLVRDRLEPAPALAGRVGRAGPARAPAPGRPR